MPRNDSFARVLRNNSQQERLSEEDGFVSQIKLVVEYMLRLEINDFAFLPHMKAVAAPAIRSRPPVYPLTLERPVYRMPRQELVRSVVLQGTYQPHMSWRMRKAHQRNGQPARFRTCEFVARCEFYFHSMRWGWQLGKIRLSYSEDGWHECISKAFRNFPTIGRKEGRIITFINLRPHTF